MIRRHVLRKELERVILSRLTGGQWQPGERVSIDGLARELGVSPTPVREALVALERSALIEHRALRGYVVSAPLSACQVGELMESRAVLERAAVSAAFRRREELLPELRSAHSAHEQSGRTVLASSAFDFSSVQAYFDGDTAFHDQFFEFAGNGYLASMRDVLASHVHRMRQTWAEGPAQLDVSEAIAEHREILRCVEENNHDGALRAMDEHLDNVRIRSGGTRNCEAVAHGSCEPAVP